ncbi:glucose-1-phosphate thymidylyltransferase [Streptomyces sp. SID486]|uniref:glucose-1-phosphate thymidylyltransferase n=1 Tax=unclassified Streptomyces TaxID=2593676 RepID=UPI0013720742|nr:MULTISPECIES: glucose-1-phosphate thymidylyltransferase [unclassified Streptomyces]MYW17783.1 glucose-1-phosphate thymidylyltransferase [Streptomyces sp. SID2955]MYW48055.1 glucose-1-phosphate thymidylyltransferase [Streptomyces sp. SID161]MYX97261.1 glucose-1-phosphate thymidylyltransferase [Streptomyces sp. SID486]
MKALILSGGMGTRLRPFTYSMPKQLVPVANKPILVHCLENVRAIGVEDVAVVVGDRGPEIRAVVGDGSAYGLNITYLRQEAPLGLAHAVSIAEEFLGDDDFVMYLGDNVLAEGIAESARAFHAGRPAAQLLLTKVADPRAYGVAEVDAEGRVLALVEKPQQPRSDLAVIGVYFFTAAVHDAVRAIEPSARGELEITDAIQYLVERGDRVVADEYAGYWKDTGSPDDLLDCNRLLLGRLGHGVHGQVDAASTVEGPVLVEAGAVVERSRLVGPLIVGAGSVVRDSELGPYTALGRDCALDGAGIGDSIVLDGVSIQNVRGLSGSIIGRSAAVRGGEAAGRRLIIGDHTRAEVAA